MPLLGFLSGVNNVAMAFHGVPCGKWFNAILNALGNVYDFISAEDVESYYYGRKEIKNSCLISFDDGDVTFYDNAYPVLKKAGIPAALFVSPKIIRENSNYWFQELSFLISKIGADELKKTICRVKGWDQKRIKKYDIYLLFKSMRLADIMELMNVVKEAHEINIDRRYNMTESQLKDVDRSGIVTVGAHTMNHPILGNETSDDAQKEIRNSISGLAETLNKKITYFAYPNGISGLDYGFREETVLREGGIKLAFSMDAGFFKKGQDPLNIPRGTCSGTREENRFWVTGRTLLLPAWEKLRQVLKPWSRTEKAARLEIKRLNVL